MKYRHVIAKDGKVVTEVLERTQGENCDIIVQHTAGLGKTLSDEKTGPDCDKQFEVSKE